MTHTTGAKPTTYRVHPKWPMLQIFSQNPSATGSASSGALESTQRTFRAGDVLPTWLSEAEIAHLLSMEAIEPLG